MKILLLIICIIIFAFWSSLKTKESFSDSFCLNSSESSPGCSMCKDVINTYNTTPYKNRFNFQDCTNKIYQECPCIKPECFEQYECKDFEKFIKQFAEISKCKIKKITLQNSQESDLVDGEKMKKSNRLPNVMLIY